MPQLKFATWNVNSLRVRLPQVLSWLKLHQPDVLALQEIKLTNDNFPLEEIRAHGYEATFSGQRTYNGVALLTKAPVHNIVTDIPNYLDPQRRVLAATLNDIRIVNLYVPNGEAVNSEKYIYKLNWLNELHRWLKNDLIHYPKMVVMGDFNIAPHELDVHDPTLWAGKVLFSENERLALSNLLSIGFHDCFRLLAPEAKAYSWWDYRLNSFKRNLGMRIDHILASDALKLQCNACEIDLLPRGFERPSDHAPVIAAFND